MAIASVTKDPQADLDYGLNWAPWLISPDVLSGSTWVVSGPDSSLVATDLGHSDAITAVRLQGGTVGARYTITNHITTVGDGFPRQDDRSVEVKMSER
jgi:hypothetical protein